MRRLNDKQKENLAIFYNNLALAVVTFGIISPVFTGINNYVIFGLQALFSVIGTILLLQFSLLFLK